MPRRGIPAIPAKETRFFSHAFTSYASGVSSAVKSMTGALESASAVGGRNSTRFDGAGIAAAEEDGKADAFEGGSEKLTPRPRPLVGFTISRTI